ncbi:hypothetical protein AYO20_11281 [Fonsecaea nubica]|uniref:Uncharacterized protein n=1 Tax=Fonsecaea nubica TaxID=856822 RepID=A0A178BYU5_9EURO|nr:hypothetical protein AYO20_11281 [Fonsecaea nubica]OAL22045.1 hypothetical protein AYO20_11281 [Fonsecaea nubica]
MKTNQERGNSDGAATEVKLFKFAGALYDLDQIFKESESVFLNTPRRKVFRYENTVFKFGADVSPFEAKALQFMGDINGVPVPRLYCYDFVGQLREILEKMRQYKSAGSAIGGIHGGPAVDARRLKRKGGPFTTEEQFNEFLRSGMITTAPKIYRTMLER